MTRFDVELIIEYNRLEKLKLNCLDTVQKSTFETNNQKEIVLQTIDQIEQNQKKICAALDAAGINIHDFTNLPKLAAEDFEFLVPGKGKSRKAKLQMAHGVLSQLRQDDVIIVEPDSDVYCS